MRQKMIKIKIKIVSILSVALLLPFCKETPESYYPTLKDAEKDNAIERGWIPNVLPPTTREITERHNIDTCIVWIKFKADVPDLERLSRQLISLTEKDIDRLFPIPNPPKWWIPTDDTKHSFFIGAYDYTFKWSDGRADKKTGYFFLDIEKAIGFYYSPAH